MAKVQTIRRRIKSVKNINQITYAMQMVAASKLRRAQEATLRSRTYALSAREALARLKQLTRTEEHPLFAQRTIDKRLIILFSSDRGLAGAYNSNIFRALLTTIRAGTSREAARSRTILIVVGQKGAQFMAKLAGDVEVVGVYTGWPARPTIQDTNPLAATAIDQFRRGLVDQVSLLYTDFISTVKQNVVVRDILPVDPTLILPADGRVSLEIREALWEPSPAAVLQYIVPRLIEVQIYQASLEAIASEQSMRMLAMKNASDNAQELIGDLTLTYNGVRQAAITQELAEITSGAEAIK
ncbi:MAG: ATP synthase F1 subunit gamma [Candidatus Andersenbacteria bacterium]